MEEFSVTNKVKLQKLELHEINEKEVRIEVALSLNNRTEEIERVSQNSDEAIFIALGLATIDLIRLLIPRPLDCQIDYIKKRDVKPLPTIQSLLRLNEHGKETFLSGNIIIDKTPYEAVISSVLEALSKTLEKMIELQQRRERTGRTGSLLALDANTIAVALELSERKTQELAAISDSKNNQLDENSINSLEQANKEINANRAKELYEQSEWLIRKGNYDKAAFLLKEAISLDQSNADYYSQLGIALSNTSVLEGAEDAFLKAIDLSPKTANHYTELGLFYKEVGRIDKAQKSLEKALELDPFDVRSKRALATVKDLICAFEPVKEKVTSQKINDAAKLNELKEAIKSKPDNDLSGFFSKDVSRKVIAICFATILLFFVGFAGIIYIYNYFYVTNKSKFSEKDLAQPHYVAIKIVQNFPSSVKGMSIKENVEKYLKEQRISVYNWHTVKESKSGNYIVVVTFTKNGNEENAFWMVELDKKICVAGNDLARFFSAS